MQRLFLIIGFVLMLGAVGVSAQNKGTDIPLMVIVPEQTDGLPEGAQAYLENKLVQVVSAQGLVGGTTYARFFVAPKIALGSKDVVAGTKTNVALNIEMTLYIGDYTGQKIFSTTTLNLKGVGTNETKAYISGIRTINPQNKAIQDFLAEGKAKIMTWYDTQCDNIIKEADMLALQKDYKQALYLLTSVPNASQCYDKALKATQKVWQQYVDYVCEVNMAQARTIWAANQSMDGANEAGRYLSEIYPDAKCYGDAQKLVNEIKAKTKDDWKFVQKIYQDGVDLESQRINAAREIGVAFGKGQQPSTTIIGFLR